MEDVWKTVEGYEDYEVCTNGKIRSWNKKFLNSPRMLNPKSNSDGYCRVKLRNNGMPKLLNVHRLVAKAFLSDYSEDLQVDHINGVRNDNRLENLRMCTHQENNWGEGFSGVEPRRDKLLHMNKNIKSKAVRQYSLATGEFIAEYFSGRDAERRVSDVSSGGISRCCMGKTVSSGGFQWRYAAENIEKLDPLPLK